MNAILLTVLALGGASGTKTIDVASHGEVAAGTCDDCYGGGRCGHGGGHGHGHWLDGECKGPMPQTCYDPAYGCYPGTRFMNRYPAFHGTYYRRPYNYRNVFDYPWHADLHEPTSFFSYQVTGETAEGGRPLRAEPVPPAPMPVPLPAAAIPLHRQIEQSTAGAPSTRSQKGLPTLRR